MFLSQEKNWLDMSNILQVTILILSKEVEYLFLSLNYIGEKSQATIIFGKFVNNP